MAQVKEEEKKVDMFPDLFASDIPEAGVVLDEMAADELVGLHVQLGRKRLIEGINKMKAERKTRVVVDTAGMSETVLTVLINDLMERGYLGNVNADGNLMATIPTMVRKKNES